MEDEDESNLDAARCLGIIKDASDPKKELTDEKETRKSQEREYKAYNTLLLHLNDRVLRDVSKEESATDVWAKLESLYMTKSLANRLHLKQKLLTFKISEGKTLSEQIDEFGKCIDDLENIDDKIKDEDKALMLLNSLPKSFEHFKDAILLGRESKVSYEEVSSALKLKEVQKSVSTLRIVDTTGESLNIKAAERKTSKKKWQGSK